MTVGELIAKLQEMPQDSEVSIGYEENSWRHVESDVGEIELKTYRQAYNVVINVKE